MKQLLLLKHLNNNPKRAQNRHLASNAFCLFLLIIVVAGYIPFHGICLSEVHATEAPSRDVNFVALWVRQKKDNQQLPFIILDKKNAHLFVFSDAGDLLGDAPVLLGMSVGDVLPRHVIGKSLSQIPVKDRITQAGRFLAYKGFDTHRKPVIWVDIESRLAIHEVVNTPSQKRFERLASATTSDNRISWGCINVPIVFFQSVLISAFTSGKGYVYILPETSPVAEFFGIDTELY